MMRFKKYLSCETITIPPSKACRYSSNHLIEGRSKWFVGSSNKRISGDCNNILASMTRILHHPEKVHKGRFCSSSLKPNPAKISCDLYSMLYPYKDSYSICLTVSLSNNSSYYSF